MLYQVSYEVTEKIRTKKLKEYFVEVEDTLLTKFERAAFISYRMVLYDVFEISDPLSRLDN